MKLPADILTESPAEAARDIALAQLDACEKRARELATGEGEDPLHDFRVSVRRLRSTLRAWKPLLRKRVKKKHTKALADVQTATGGGRDCEVAVEWIQGRQGAVSAEEEVGEAWVASALEARLQEEMGDVRTEALEAFDEIARKLRKRLARVKPRAHRADEEAPTFGAALGLALRAHMDDLIAHLGAIHSIDDVEEAHRARIRLKRLRYLVEPLRGVLPGVRKCVAHCKDLQDILGDMNDARVLGAELEQLSPIEGEEGERIAAGLSSLKRGVDERLASLYAMLVRDWLSNGAQVLREGINQMILACLQPGSEPLEIEHKFLLSALPAQMPAASEITIDQGYLPGDHPRERLRAKARAGSEPQYVRTIKVGSGLARVEVEGAVSPAVFEVLWPLTEGCRIRKRRYVVPVGDRKWEIDEFLDRDDLYYAEIELDSADEEVILPDWLAPVVVRELTGEPGSSNLELAK